MNHRLCIAGAIVLAWSSQAPATAQRVSIDAALHASDKPYVQATGDATVRVKPDQALVEVGVVTQGSTVIDAAGLNAKQTDTVLAQLRTLLSGKGQMKTTSYSVRPNYRYPKPGAAAIISGYIATNTVEVKLDDLAQVTKVIDASIESGANVIQSLQYQLKDAHRVHAQALRDAAEHAKASAEAIASGLGLKVIRVLSAEETLADEGFGYKKSAPPPPPPGGQALATPLEIGMIEIDATVSVRAEVGQ